MYQIIHIHPDAPVKPPEGAPCNGCGVCCLLEPCPVGMLISRKRRGACTALGWSDASGRYRCGLMLSAGAEAEAGAEAKGNADGAGGPPQSVWRHPVRALALRWVRRVITAGSGCDASLEVSQQADTD